MLIFEQSVSDRRAHLHVPSIEGVDLGFPAELMRDNKPCLPEVSELQAVRHYTKLSQKNFSIDTQFYPLVLVR